MAPASYLVLWRFDVAEEHRADFEAAYGPDGAWAALFGGADGYLGTELISVDPAGTFITIDRWSAASAYELFRRTHRRAYEALDHALEALTLSERFLGAGTTKEGTPR